jgi:hypothetical protein
MMRQIDGCRIYMGRTRSWEKQGGRYRGLLASGLRVAT